MWTKFATIAAPAVAIVLAAPAHAQPNYSVFLQAIASDGIVMDSQEAIEEGHAVCEFMAPPDGGSLWDAAQFVVSKHPDLRIGSALDFANRAVQDICPNRGSF